MNLSISRHKGALTERETVNCITSLSEILLPYKIFKKVNLAIFFVKDAELGYEGLLEQITKWRYVMSVATNNISKKEQIKTICHEMVHLQQFVSGKLDIIDLGKKGKWEGKWHKYYDINEHKMPWEKIAYGSEEKLYRKIMSKG